MTCITKRHHADGRQLALRVDDTLYYTLLDPTGTSLTLTDENGGEAGYILYDAFGGVLTSTLPATLSTALAGQGNVADPATGLVHLGGGRYYDPSLGRPLQPNPTGGPPSVPQALNRYSATSLGQPGVAQAVVSGGYYLGPDLVGLAKDLTVGNVLSKFGATFPVAVGYRHTGRATFDIVTSAGIRPGNTFIDFAVDTKRYFLAEAMNDVNYQLGLISRETYLARFTSLTGQRKAAYGAAIRARANDSSAWINPIDPGDITTTQRYGVLDDLFVGRLIGRGLGVGIDFAIAGGFEAYDIWADPFYTSGQKWRRVGVVGTTNALGAAVGVGIAGLVCTSPLAPGCIAASIVFGTVGALFADAALTEPFSQVLVGPKERRLRPLSQ